MAHPADLRKDNASSMASLAEQSILNFPLAAHAQDSPDDVAVAPCHLSCPSAPSSMTGSISKSFESLM